MDFGSTLNETHIEKGSCPCTCTCPLTEIKELFDCSTAKYDKVTLHDFVYKHYCFPEGWETFLEIEIVKKDIEKISEALEEDAEKYAIEPPMPDVFKAFTVKPGDIRAIIIGQDPTPQAGKATGLAFSLKPTEDPRDVQSVINMLVELKLEGIDVSLTNGDLTPWLKEGVFLFNAALTVRQDDAGSHLNLWVEFTRLVVEYVNMVSKPSAWIFWGTHAQGAARLIDEKKHYIRKGGHPSPTGGGRSEFFGGNYFHCANDFLAKNKRGTINWQINDRSRHETDMKPC